MTASFAPPLLFGLVVLSAVSRPERVRGADEPADPVPIRRILLPSERVPAELGRVRQGAFVQLSPEEFAEKLRQARRAAAALSNPPRLLVARYSASLLPDALAGTAQWTARNWGGTPALLPLQPLNLAVRKARLGAAETATTDAAIGDLDGKSLGWLLDRDGEQSAALEWTARGIPFPGGLRFDVRVPPAALATLELTAPEDRVVDRGANCLVSGPFPTDRAGWKRWHIDCAGKSQLELVVRDARRSGAAPLLIAQVDARWDLEPDLFRGEFDFTVEVLREAVRELTFECDPELHPYEISGRDVESWELQPRPAPSRASSLTLRLRAPLHDGLFQVKIRALAPANRSSRWTAPSLGLRQALLRAENIVLRVHPDLRLEEWNSGSYRFVAGPSLGAGAPPRTRDGWQLIALAGRGMAATRPSARLVMRGPEYRCRQLTWWHVSPQQSTLSAEIAFELVQGELHRPVVELPQGWDVDNVEMTPANLLRSWSVAQEAERSLLLVDLHHSLGAAAGSVAPAPRLRLQLHPRRPELITRSGHSFPFPQLRPTGARFLEGAYAISLDAALKGTPDTMAIAQPAPERGPWEARTPDYCYSHRGIPAAGKLHVQLRAQQLQARCTSAVILAPERSSVEMQVALQPRRGGAAETVDLLVTAPVVGGLRWKIGPGTSAIRSVHRWYGPEIALRLSWLGNPLPVPLVLGLASQRPFEIWRTTFTQPLRDTVVLHASAILEAERGMDGRTQTDTHAREPVNRNWTVPLPVVLGAESLVGEVTVYVRGVDAAQCQSGGLVEISVPAESGSPRPWRSYRYGESLPALSLAGRCDDIATSLLPSGPTVDDAMLSATLGADRVCYQFRCEVRDWPQSVLPLRLPPGTRGLTLQIDGRWLPYLTATDLADGATLLQVPFPAGKGHHRLHVVYDAPLAPWFFETRIPALSPGLPIAVGAIANRWELPPGVVPVSPGYRQTVAGDRVSADATPLSTHNDPTLGPAGAGWEAVVGMADAAYVRVARQSVVTVAALAVAAGWLLLFWKGGGPTRRLGLGLLLAWLAYGSLGTLWLPSSLQPFAWYPVVAGTLMMGWTLVRAAARGTGSAKSLGATAALGAIVMLPCSGGWAESPAPFTVYLLTSRDQPREVRSILAPPELVELLAKQSAGALQPVALIGAEYDGSVNGARAEFHARYRLRSFSAAPATVVIPLGGVQLQSARWNDSEIHPAATRAPREGYAFEVRGPGNHEVTIQFSVPIQESGEHCELRFAIPEVIQNRLELRLPAGARTPFAVAARGAQRVLSVEGTDSKPVALEADLGAVGALQVRWRRDPTRSRPAAVGVREAYLWEFRPTLSELRAVLQYTVGEGSATSLALALPEPLEVQRVEATRLPNASADEPLPRVRDWRISGAGGARRLSIELHRAAGSGVQLNLEIIARLALPTIGSVPLPAPLDAQRSEGYLAYHADDMRVSVQQPLRIAEDRADGFAQFWRSAGEDDPGGDIRAFRFSRAAVAPLLKLHFKDPAAGVDCIQADTWRVGLHHAEVTALASLTARHRDLQLVEWNVAPSLVGVEVTGPEVRSWARAGSRVQVWLSKPCERAELKVTAWQPLQEAEDGRTSVPTSVFTLPALELHVPGTLRRFVSIAPLAESIVLDPRSTQQLMPLPDPRPRASDFHYAATSGSPTAAFLARSASERDRDAPSAKTGTNAQPQPTVVAPSRATAPARWLLTDRVARVRTQRWRHAVHYRIYQETATDLGISLPAGAIATTVTIDGEEVTPVLHAQQLSFTVPGTGVHSIRLEWRYPRGEEDIERPKLASPRLEGIATGPTILTVELPRGFHAKFEPQSATTLTAVEADLERAATQLELSVLLAERARARGASDIHSQLLAAQDLFFQWCLQAEANAAYNSASGERLVALQERNRELARRHGYVDSQQDAEARFRRSRIVRSAADSDEPNGSLLETWDQDDLPMGAAASWLVPSSSAAPKLQLAAPRSLSSRQRTLPTLLWTTYLIGAACVFFLPARTGWLRMYGPEQVVFLAALEWYCLRPSWWFVLLGAFGILARVWLAATALLARRRGRDKSTPEPSGATA